MATASCPLPSQRLDPFISREFGQRRTLSAAVDIVLLSLNSDARTASYSIPANAHGTWNITLTRGQFYPWLLAALKATSIERRYNQVMFGKSHESERWSSCSPKTLFVFAALSQCVRACVSVCACTAESTMRRTASSVCFSQQHGHSKHYANVVNVKKKKFSVNPANIAAFHILKSESTKKDG